MTPGQLFTVAGECLKFVQGNSSLFLYCNCHFVFLGIQCPLYPALFIVVIRSTVKNDISLKKIFSVPSGQSPTLSDRRLFFDGGLPHIPEYGRIRADLWRARSDPIQCRCDSLKANSDYLRATSDMLRLKSDVLRSKSEQLTSSTHAKESEDQKALLAKAEDLRMKANRLRRESDVLLAKVDAIRTESENSLLNEMSCYQQPDCSMAFQQRSALPTSTLCPPTPIPELVPSPEPPPAIDKVRFILIFTYAVFFKV